MSCLFSRSVLDESGNPYNLHAFFKVKLKGKCSRCTSCGVNAMSPQRVKLRKLIRAETGLPSADSRLVSGSRWTSHEPAQSSITVHSGRGVGCLPVFFVLPDARGRPCPSWSCARSPVSCLSF